MILEGITRLVSFIRCTLVRFGKFKSTIKKFSYQIWIGFFVVSLSMLWLYNLKLLPGLHGDEAWFGLKAIYIQQKGLDQLTGMTFYTGMLQCLLALIAFKIGGLGVYQLRLPGVIFNLIGLLIFVLTFQRYNQSRKAFLFSFLIASSSLFIISPRIAWEVNSLTLFFLSLCYLTYHKISYEASASHIWVVLFWIVNILGTYNHVIFGCLASAGFIGILIWGTHHELNRKTPVFFLFAFNFFNVCMTYLIMKYASTYILTKPVFAVLLIAGFFKLELIVYSFLIKVHLNLQIRTYWSKKITGTLFLASITLFVYIHGKGLIDVVSGYKIICQTFHRPCPILVQVLLRCCAFIFLFICAGLVLKYVSGGQNSLYTYILLTYLGLFNFYTPCNSFRYFLCLYLMLSLYIVHKIHYGRWQKWLVLSQLLTYAIVNIMIITNLVYLESPVRPLKFQIGNHEMESSAAFLPKQPLLRILEQKNIIDVTSSTEYFIKEPIRFYQSIRPSNTLAKDSAVILYDYKGDNGGYTIIKVN